MPNDVKASLSVLFLIVAAILAYWRGSPIRPEFSTYIMVTAVFFVVAMWVFPEAGGKKAARRKAPPAGPTVEVCHPVSRHRTKPLTQECDFTCDLFL